MNLPEAFLARMRTLLGEEYKSYLAAMEEQPLRGIRLNTLKCTRKRWLPLSRSRCSARPFRLVPITIRRRRQRWGRFPCIMPVPFIPRNPVLPLP